MKSMICKKTGGEGRNNYQQEYGMKTFQFHDKADL